MFSAANCNVSKSYLQITAKLKIISHSYRSVNDITFGVGLAKMIKNEYLSVVLWLINHYEKSLKKS